MISASCQEVRWPWSASQNNISQNTTAFHKTLQHFIKHNDISQNTTAFHKTLQHFNFYGKGIPSSPCHTVKKLTPDGHTNMELWISHEDGPELGQQPIDSRSKYDAYRRPHDGTLTTHENMVVDFTDDLECIQTQRKSLCLFGGC